MNWPKAAGKSFEGYVEDESSQLNRKQFEDQIKRYIGAELTSVVRPTHLQVLFEISDYYLRRLSLVSRVRQKKFLVADWKSRSRLINATRRRLASITRQLSASARSADKPLTAMLARSCDKKLARIDQELEAIEQHASISASMLRSTSLKQMRNSYVAGLNAYIEDVILRRVPKKGKATRVEKLISAVMKASRVFSSNQEDIEDAVHMARSRARTYLDREFYDKGEFPMFQVRPKRQNKSR